MGEGGFLFLKGEVMGIFKGYSEAPGFLFPGNGLGLDSEVKILEWVSKTQLKFLGGTNSIPIKISNDWFFSSADIPIVVSDVLDTGSISNGKDYYVYACDDDGTLKFVVSLNSSYPSGFTASNSRKIGGFHTLCADVGTISGHALTGYSANDILPASVWDLKHRPVSAPEGMVYCEAIDKWVDIYLASGTGASMVSAYEGTISDTRNWMDFVDDGHAVKKRLLEDDEFAAIAAGVREEAQIWTMADPVNTGGHTSYFLLMVDGTPTPNDWTAGDTLTGGTSGYTCTIVEKITDTTYLCKNISNATGFTASETLTASGTGTGTASYSSWAADSRGRIISDIGCEDAVGVLYQWLVTSSAKLDDGTAAGWYDLAGDKGSFYTYGTNKYGNTQLLAGGNWNVAACCGSRCRLASDYRWNTDSRRGGRFRSEPKK